MPNGAGGFFLFLFESFVARALLGSLVAAALVQVLLRRDAVRSASGRRLLLLMPFLTAGLLAVASARSGFLPKVWVDTDRIAAAGAVLDVLGDVQHIGGTVDLLVAGYLLTVGVLLSRRLIGVVTASRLRVRSALAPPAVRHRALRMALRTGIVPPEIRLQRDCPGGAFTTGVRHPWIAVDPQLAATLDTGELDALLAHEMAHIRRGDPLVNLLTGVCRDLVFFLPGIQLVTAWLRHEQEEAADDLAALSTSRPGALASSILKVWETQTGPIRLAGACAAVAPVTARRYLPARWRTVRDTAEPHALVRAQRLVDPVTASGQPVRRSEVGLPISVLALAVTVGVLIPAGVTQVLHNDGVLLQVFSAAPVTQVEAPAFATFRALAPNEVRPQPVAPATVEDVDPLCPCVESPADLRARRSAAATSPHSQLVWSSDGRDAWQIERVHEHARLRVDGELISWRGGQREVGFFTVSRNPVPTDAR